MDTSTCKMTSENGLLEQQLSKLRSLEDTLNTIRSLTVSVQDSKCTDGAHERFMKTLMETLGIPTTQGVESKSQIDNCQPHCSNCPPPGRSRPQLLKRREEIDEDCSRAKRLAVEPRDELENESTNNQRHVMGWTLEEKVMSNPLLATKIFRLLPAQDLVNLRRVNSIWNINCSRVLREHKTCLAHFYLMNKDRKCQVFNKLVENSTVLPFTGFSFKTSHPNEKRDDIPLEFFPLKHIEVDLQHIPEPNQAQTIQVLQQTFMNCAAHLEVLILTSLPKQVNRLQQLFTPQSQLQQPQELDNLLPKLTKLVLPRRTNIIQPKILKDVLKAAPNLKELLGEIVPRQVKPLVVLKKTWLVKTFKFMCKDVMDFHLTSKFARTKPSLTKLIFPKCLSTATFDAVLLYRNVFKMLCDCSQLTLEHLEVPHLTFLKFSGAAQEPIMKNLRRLTLRYDMNCGRTSGAVGFHQLALTRINFTENFPMLNFVILQLDNNLYRGTADSYFGAEFREPGAINKSYTVKKLKIKGKQANSALMYHMTIIFPNVQEIQLSKARDYMGIFDSLWSAWPGLRSLRCEMKDTYLTGSLDSTFTGYSKSQCEEMSINKKYMQSSSSWIRENSILKLKKLRKLTLDLTRSSANISSETENKPEPFFTDVTNKCAFDLMPKLKVKLLYSNAID